MTFEKIYNDYWQKVYRLCLGYINDADLAKDMAQETFVIVWQKLPEFRQESAVGTWVFRIAVNLCLRQLNRMNRSKPLQLPEEIKEINEPSQESELAFLQQCIAELPEMDRIIISLELEEVKQADIARIVGVSEGNVRVKIHRIKQNIAKKFSHHEQL